MNTDQYSNELKPKPMKPEDFTPDQIMKLMKYLSADQRLTISRNALTVFTATLTKEIERLRADVERIGAERDLMAAANADLQKQVNHD